MKHKVGDVAYSTSNFSDKWESITKANKMCNNYFDWMGIPE